MYNQEELIKILKKIQGERSLNKFAEDIKVDSAYLSRIFNYKRTNAPTPAILKKIADNSKGITTYKELMIVCGYITFESEDKKNIELDLIKSTKEIQQEQKNSNLSKEEKIIINDYLMKVVRQIKDKDLHNPKTVINILLETLSPISNDEKLFLCCIREFYLLYYFSSEELQFYNDLQKYSNEKKVSNAIPLNKGKTRKIPVVGKVAAGFDANAIVEPIGWEDLDDRFPKSNTYFGLLIQRKLNGAQNVCRRYCYS